MTIKMPHFPGQLKKLWSKWEIVGMVLSSLFLQILLIMFGSRRKRITRIWIRILVWSSYLLADMVATVALGVLSRSQLGEMGDIQFAEENSSLRAFWAPFLLVHLGGPDTITAFSIEDNELWLRHLLNLLVQGSVAFYVVLQSWDFSVLSFITIFMLFSGIAKYGERTWALRSSSTENIRNSLLSTPPRLRLDTKSIMVVPRGHHIPDQTNYLHQAYYLFKMSLYLFENLILSLTELKDSHSIISCQSSKDAFKLVDLELGFIFDRLYTKAPIVYSRKGVFLRFLTFSSSFITLVSFSFFVDKHRCSPINVATTYLLLAGALGLEVYAMLQLVFSDWTMIWLTRFTSTPSNPIGNAIYSLRAYFANEKRWSGSMAQCNLISSSFAIKTIKSLSKFMGIDQETLKHLHVSWEHTNDNLKDLIFENLLEKGNEIIEHLQDKENRRTRLLAQRGDGVLEKMKRLEEFRWCTTSVEFNQSLFIWHIATDLCYYVDQKFHSKQRMSKLLSDYMFYLLVVKPNMLPKRISDSGSRYRDASDEVERFFQVRKKEPSNGTAREARMTLFQAKQEELEDAIAIPIDTTPTIPGAYGSSKYLLVHGCKLAQQLQKLEAEKWKVISEVWVEMLTYAAGHCEWRDHAQQLKSGGELLTHVRLLMAHLGLSQQYQEILLS
ncbi:hypothetical protein POPTR_003G064200v4 [Populus trichocarpa]|nr:hypothetical protein POPTR_003G064200v4 [Populus trichocarpa]